MNNEDLYEKAYEALCNKLNCALKLSPDKLISVHYDNLWYLLRNADTKGFITACKYDPNEEHKLIVEALLGNNVVIYAYDNCSMKQVFIMPANESLESLLIKEDLNNA